MRILLVTFSELLPTTLLSILNPELECCAIVVDEPERAKQILEDNPLTNIIYPFYELKDCADNFYYDCIVFATPFWEFPNVANIEKWGLPKKLLVSVPSIHTPENFYIERALRYYKEHAAEFEMFATGSSFVHNALDTKKFTLKLFNFGHSSQDLYYSYKIAKYLLHEAGGGSYIKYALIGFFPHHIYYDESKAVSQNCRQLQYAIALNDIHNFWLPIEKYKSLFHPEFLNIKMPFESEMNRITPLPETVEHITLPGRLAAREQIDSWKERSYPETFKEIVKILDDYLTLCEENNVRPIVFCTPMTYGYMKHFDKKILDAYHYVLRMAQEKHPHAVFFDGWRLQDFSDDDFVDVNHMNIQGAAKFSAILNSIIEGLEQ